MTDFFSTLIRVLVRMVFFAMGLVFALSLLCAAAVLALLWGARRLWARLTGKPVPAWVFRVNPKAGWNRFSQGPQAWTGAATAARAGASDAGGAAAREAEGSRLAGAAGTADWRNQRPHDVTDVNPK